MNDVTNIATIRREGTHLYVGVAKSGKVVIHKEGNSSATGLLTLTVNDAAALAAAIDDAAGRADEIAAVHRDAERMTAAIAEARDAQLAQAATRGRL